MWWLTVIMVLAAAVVFELLIASVRRVFWPRDQDLMQELEKDAGIMEVMKEHAAERGEAAAGEAVTVSTSTVPLQTKDAKAAGVRTSVNITPVSPDPNASGRPSLHIVAEEPSKAQKDQQRDKMTKNRPLLVTRHSSEPQRSVSWLAEMSGANNGGTLVQSPVETRMAGIDELRRE
jgi:phospholipid-translocating ATPase